MGSLEDREGAGAVRGDKVLGKMPLSWRGSCGGSVGSREQRAGSRAPRRGHQQVVLLFQGS